MLSYLDAASQAKIERGKRIVEVFKQTQYKPVPVEVQAVVLWAAQNAFADDVPVDKVKDFQDKLADFLTSRKADLMARIRKEKALSDELTTDVKSAVTEFKQSYKPA